MAISKGAGARVLGAGLALAIGGGARNLCRPWARQPRRAGRCCSRPTGILSGHGGQSTGTGAPSPAMTPAVAGVGSPLSEISEVSGGGGDAFGTSVAISGSTAVVGAPAETANGNPAQGVVRIYAKSGTAWVLQAEIHLGRRRDGGPVRFLVGNHRFDPGRGRPRTHGRRPQDKCRSGLRLHQERDGVEPDSRARAVRSELGERVRHQRLDLGLDDRRGRSLPQHRHLL